MGMHALMIFILATSNVLPVVMQGFYWKQPGNNIVIFPLLCSCNFFSTIAILQSDKTSYIWQLRLIGIGR
jgi:hypothetical protein